MKERKNGRPQSDVHFKTFVFYIKNALFKLKGTVNIISSDPPFIERHVRFTTAVSDQE